MPESVKKAREQMKSNHQKVLDVVGTEGPKPEYMKSRRFDYVPLPEGNGSEIISANLLSRKCEISLISFTAPTLMKYASLVKQRIVFSGKSKQGFITDGVPELMTSADYHKIHEGYNVKAEKAKVDLIVERLSKANKLIDSNHLERYLMVRNTRLICYI